MIWQKIISGMEISYLKEVLQSYQKIASEHEEALAKAEVEWKQILEDEVNEHGRSNKELYGDMLGEQAHENEMIQQILARSFILAICMTIEHQLGDLCRHIQKEHEEKISLKDFRGSGRGMKSRIEYVEAVTQKKFMAENMDLELLIKLRNIIVHDNGVLTNDLQNELESKYKNSSLKPIIHENKLYFEISTLENFLTFSEAIMANTMPFWTYEQKPIS